MWTTANRARYNRDNLRYPSRSPYLRSSLDKTKRNQEYRIGIPGSDPGYDSPPRRLARRMHADYISD